MLDIAQKIKNYRKSKGLTQEQLAEAINMDIKNYQNLESGKTDVRQSHINKIAKALKINPLELLNTGEKHIYMNDAVNANNDFFNYNDGIIIFGTIEEKHKKLVEDLITFKKENELLRGIMTEFKETIQNLRK